MRSKLDGVSERTMRAVELWNRGRTMRWIAVQEEVSPTAIQRRLKRAEPFGLLKRPLPGKSYFKRNGRPLSPAVHRTVRAWNRGKSIAQIAVMESVTTSAISYRLARAKQRGLLTR